MIQSVNPATGELLAEFIDADDAAIETALAGAHLAQKDWARRPLEERCALVARLADVLRENKARYARLITLEMGKPIAEATAEIEKCAVTAQHYAAEAGRYLAPEVVASNAAHSAVVFDPMGVVLAVMPWNYPFWQFVRFAAPALAAGNGAILKHASNVPQCALAIEDAFLEAGFPRGLVGNLLVGPSKVARILADDRIAAVTLTGSTGVGSLVAAEAGRLLKPQVLELGGSDPFIVLADADVEAAAATAVKARFQNTGQSCIAAKRFLVEDAVADAFTEAMVAKARTLVVGDPLEAATQIGPMARASLRGELHGQVERSLAAGARLLLGGAPVDGPGAFYQPTILDGVTPEMAVFGEETFGPAAAIIRVPDADTAVDLANRSEFGLGAAIWTGDTERAIPLARRIEAGAVFVNGLVASDARLPFGGVKQSGYGRELGVYGIRAFTNVKTIWVGPAR
jgi:NAD-dependent aldehyde dehydrogenases